MKKIDLIFVGGPNAPENYRIGELVSFPTEEAMMLLKEVWWNMAATENNFDSEEPVRYESCLECPKVMLCPFPIKDHCPHLKKYEKTPRYF